MYIKHLCSKLLLSFSTVVAVEINHGSQKATPENIANPTMVASYYYFTYTDAIQCYIHNIYCYKNFQKLK